MPAEFLLINERVILTKYTEPMYASDFDAMSVQIAAYAETAIQTIFVIADFTEVERFPSFMLGIGLRRGNTNPVRNPRIERIVVVAHAPLIERLASMVAKITGIKKFSIVATL